MTHTSKCGWAISLQARVDHIEKYFTKYHYRYSCCGKAKYGYEWGLGMIYIFQVEVVEPKSDTFVIFSILGKLNSFGKSSIFFFHRSTKLQRVYILFTVNYKLKCNL